ncbi:hypothetical protein Gogos_021085 [Gossypium gossypioides]|uniref:Uncharacterized protein n=1 Tax=Gossypium gossypioides TaxID=34282 RepID=A0A7J9D8B9_GOSGO|nr:hypothetical protein [Gossypium gossypioides]
MGTQLHLFLELPTPPLTSSPLLRLNKSLVITNNILRCNSTGFHRTNGRFRLDPPNPDDDDDEFEFTSAAKQRNWWSDYDDYDDVWEFDEDNEFWVFKVIKRYLFFLIKLFWLSYNGAARIGFFSVAKDFSFEDMRIFLHCVSVFISVAYGKSIMVVRLSLELEDNALRAARFSDCIHAMDVDCYLQIFRAFGWMLPAIAISLLLGTGPNAFIMALAVPLGQSALSLVFDKVSGRTNESWKSAPRRKTKKKQFTRAAANNTRTNKGKQEPNKTGGEKESYSSWLNTDGGLQDKGGQRVPKYGGWDQLDDQVETQKRATSQKGNGAPKQRKEDKFNRVGRDRVRDTPLLLRLLIAVFPFLGSWTRFLF